MRSPAAWKAAEKARYLVGMNPHSEARFLTRQEVANRWRQSQETVKCRERCGLLHPLKFGRSVRYDVREILALEEKARV